MHKDILRQIFVKSEQSICDVIRLLDKTGYGVVLVVDDDGKLQGTITDGDLRRGMLRGVSFESSCAEIVNTTPLFVSDELPREQIKKLFDNNSKKIALDQIPVLDSHGCIVDLMLRSDFMKEPEKDNIVVIMAGGLGSRLTPLTLDCPKP
ncbi:MAG: CBS domain-containing protein, partial [Coxiellaceae bacterium]|nr:CBS domain-containing protein [Coxiellaceae bacterium]